MRHKAIAPMRRYEAVVTKWQAPSGLCSESCTVKIGEKMLEFAYSLDNVDSQRREMPLAGLLGFN